MQSLLDAAKLGEKMMKPAVPVPGPGDFLELPTGNFVSGTTQPIEEDAEAPRQWSQRRLKRSLSTGSFREPARDVEYCADKYAELLEELFPNIVPEEVLISEVTKVLNAHGFTPKTAINLVSCCRDELCRPFTDELDSKWGHSFNISSLGGMVFCGRTGFKAAMAHSPTVEGKERYVFWVAPHIAMPMSGEEGLIYRTGREGMSNACGALIALHGEISRGNLNLQLDNDDIEQSMLKQQIVSNLQYGKVPSLVELTYAAHECIKSEVHRIAKAAVNPQACEYVVVAGIQVHGALGQNFFWPGSITKVVDGKTTDLMPQFLASPAGTALHEWTKNDALALLQFQEREARISAQQGDMIKLTSAEFPLSSVRDNRKRTLLHIAAMYAQPKVAEMLLERYPGLKREVDVNGRTALEYAVQAGNDEVASLIAERGVGLMGEWLAAQLISAVQDCDCDKVNRLMEFAEDPIDAMSAVDEDGRTLAQMVTSADRRKVGRARMLQTLTKYGVDIEGGESYGHDALAKQLASDLPLVRPREAELSSSAVRDTPSPSSRASAFSTTPAEEAAGAGEAEMGKMSINEVLQSLSDKDLTALRGKAELSTMSVGELLQNLSDDALHNLCKAAPGLLVKL